MSGPGQDPFDSEAEGAVAEVVANWRERGVRNVRFELPDMHGGSRSKVVPIDHVESYARSGLNMYGGTAVLDTRSDVVPGTLYNEEVSYGDQLLRPDPETAAIVPWAEDTARFICDAFWSDGRPLDASPRQVFARVLARAHGHGLEPLVGVEPEFYLLDRESMEPLFGGHHIFNTVRNNWVPVIDRILADSAAFGIDIITANCEYAGSQWEINFAPGRGIAGPDQVFGFRNAVKEIAHLEGYVATFMSKPFSDAAGSGAHNHIGLLELEGGDNAMAGDDPETGLSPLGRSFIAGQLRYACSIYAVLAPTLNCMKRRRTHTFSPTNVSWGIEDRSALVRIKGGSEQSRHIENRAPTGMSNPYLATAALLGSGLLGIELELELGPQARPPAEEDPSLKHLPTSVEESLSLLEGEAEIVELLGSDFVTAFATMRRYELARFADHVTDWERAEYLELY
ncbi:MAG: glutamine synthetase family protein [Solirubrobacterales bacterium]